MAVKKAEDLQKNKSSAFCLYTVIVQKKDTITMLIKPDDGTLTLDCNAVLGALGIEEKIDYGR